MSRIGILAYGSLIEDPGFELEPLIVDVVTDVETPFKIEFARSSRTRDAAPTVVPVDHFGATVIGLILVLHESVKIELARDLLWRRETRNEGSNRRYKSPISPSPNRISIVEVSGLGGIDTVLYTKFDANIVTPTSKKLALLAIKSAASNAGSAGKDGISYLISLERQNIRTPLMAQYKEDILSIVGASTLHEAHKLVRMRANKC